MEGRRNGREVDLVLVMVKGSKDQRGSGKYEICTGIFHFHSF